MLSREGVRVQAADVHASGFRSFLQALKRCLHGSVSAGYRSSI